MKKIKRKNKKNTQTHNAIEKKERKKIGDFPTTSTSKHT